MIDVALVKKAGVLEPNSAEDAAALSELVDGAVIRAKLTALRKPRSYRQLALFWACCREVADNADGPNDMYWRTSKMVAERVKLELPFIDVEACTVMPGSGTVHIVTASISYKALPHMEACRFFERAWPILADRLGITVEEMHRHTEEQIRWSPAAVAGFG